MRCAKAHAAKLNITLRELVEQGVRLAIREEPSKEKFVMKDVSVSGNGLNPELRGKDWGEIRSLIYEGRGV